MHTAALLLSVLTLLAARGQAGKDEPKAGSGKFPEFTGRVHAPVAEIRPRVSGYLTKIAVDVGQAVKAGELLAEIDPKPRKVELDVARAKVAVAEGQMKLAEMNHTRAKRAHDGGAGSKEELARAAAELALAEAGVSLARAESAMAELNLSYTRLVAPFDGRVGARRLDPGNLVAADGPPVFTLYGSPLRVEFDVDERTVLRLHDAIADGRVKPEKLAAAVGFADEDGFPRLLAVGFIDTSIDPKTGTLRFGAKLPDPKGTIYPGMSVRVRLTLAK